jgi:hypothetical protein
MDKATYRVRNRIRKHNELLADIQEIDIKVQEIEEEILGISAQGTEERTGKTYKITSSVEQQAERLMERKANLYKEQVTKRRELKRIDNAMTILTAEERDIIQMAIILKEKYWKLEEKYNLTYSALKQREYNALNKMKKYLL